MTSNNNKASTTQLVLASIAIVGVTTGLVLLWRGKKKRPTGGTVIGHVSALNIHPIKSCGGVKVEAGEVEARGFRFDRLWMVVDAAGNFCTQRTVPKMAKVRPSLPASLSDPLEVDAPGMPKLTAPVDLQGTKRRVRVWGEYLEAIDQGDEAAKWFQTFLEKPGVRLVRFPEGFKRQVDPRYAPKGQITGYSDGFPFLLISEGSLQDLNKRLDSPIPMNRFRPNIVVSGVEPFAEDSWNEFEISNILMKIAKPCSRCKIPNTDQETAVVGQEPGKTLRTYRTGEQLKFTDAKEKWTNEIFFGQNVIHEDLSGTIRVGDPVILHSRKTKR